MPNNWLSVEKKPWFVMLANFYGVNTPLWLISSFHAKSLNTLLGRDVRHDVHPQHPQLISKELFVSHSL